MTGPAYAVLAGSIRARILSGELVPGERLPNEQELSAEFGVGRSTVREALRSLASQDLIQTTRGVSGGSFVSVPTAAHLSAHLETGVALMAAAERVTVGQLMSLRHLLEVPAAGEAARNRTDEQLDDLRRAEFDPSVESGDATYAANQDFHLVLLRATGNPLLEVITAPLFRVLATRFGRDHAPDGFWACVADDHAELHDLVAARDAEGAVAAMRRHLDHLTGAYQQMDRLSRS
ncbi:FadR/GntR family transcriptional regulator [Klenkia brasiliensis]|uniref:DNA-binding transcriptional regulator, FadR family n=1 Tax=Klenkia brasiliensis TaxID=333142 RepID=A0A1G7PU96_9ACTN|nr:FadR/GntR family transcriptional regulator [Klenkia brasiliensis]SDF89818.1 DNA-binding transcriptional regulator, FadR family [Klenkia brasiliensis]